MTPKAYAEGPTTEWTPLLQDGDHVTSEGAYCLHPHICSFRHKLTYLHSCASAFLLTLFVATLLLSLAYLDRGTKVNPSTTSVSEVDGRSIFNPATPGLLGQAKENVNPLHELTDDPLTNNLMKHDKDEVDDDDWQMPKGRDTIPRVPTAEEDYAANMHKYSTVRKISDSIPMEPIPNEGPRMPYHTPEEDYHKYNTDKFFPDLQS